MIVRCIVLKKKNNIYKAIEVSFGEPTALFENSKARISALFVFSMSAIKGKQKRANVPSFTANNSTINFLNNESVTNEVKRMLFPQQIRFHDLHTNTILRSSVHNFNKS